MWYFTFGSNNAISSFMHCSRPHSYVTKFRLRQAQGCTAVKKATLFIVELPVQNKIPLQFQGIKIEIVLQKYVSHQGKITPWYGVLPPRAIQMDSIMEPVFCDHPLVPVVLVVNYGGHKTQVNFKVKG